MKSRTVSLIVFATLIGILGCGFLIPGRSSVDLPSLRKEIDELIGQRRAERLDQCRAIAFGSKPCGGPWKYLVYSTLETDSLELQRLVARYNRLEAEINRSEGRASDCAFVTRPDTALAGGRCILKP